MDPTFNPDAGHAGHSPAPLFLEAPMIENRPEVYAPFISPFRAKKERDEVLGLRVSRGPSECGYDVRLWEPIELIQGYSVLASTHESVGMPMHMAADVMGKSTWARLGVSLNTTKVDPGYNGPITIEITYNPPWDGWWANLKSLFWPRRLKLPAGVGIGTLVFTNLAHAVQYDGKYGRHKAGPQEAR